MQKTLIDPFELASRTLSAQRAAIPPTHTDADDAVDASHEAAAAEQRKTTPPSEPWARVRFWCSED
jgi:hypothetical protein